WCRWDLGGNESRTWLETPLGKRFALLRRENLTVLEMSSLSTAAPQESKFRSKILLLTWTVASPVRVKWSPNARSRTLRKFLRACSREKARAPALPFWCATKIRRARTTAISRTSTAQVMPITRWIKSMVHVITAAVVVRVHGRRWLGL